MKKVSVIMPCFNDGKYIQESIECALNQTYKNIELIIIDDGSTEQETINILKNIKDNRIKILNTSRLGPSGARNKGINECDGDYILPLDSDDIIDETYIEKAVNIIESNSNIGIVYCEAELFGEREGKWELPSYSIGEMLVNNVIFVTALFRKKDWELVGGFDISFKKGLEDYDFWLSILELGRDAVQIPEILFRYRIKPVSRNKSFEEDINNVKEVYEKIYKKHKKLYMQNIDEYIIEMRRLILEDQFKRKSFISKIKNIPLINIVFKSDKIKKNLKKILYS